ncbi:MAG: pyridoxal phosphate-dependent aminotransferase [Bacteroidales bacterium]|jgi:aspartate aminotransferase|nr:pyridoxal phosphate-dependent aminotransferase [Bacteroidales bacterium]MCI2121678.1 pyridoxal phosphate-dependent aminotransferase [Bacteroidales bacterium]MCI2144643.1 pyridoxal phosphate-dependent aminotransferase [Bacteroidales bacterium]
MPEISKKSGSIPSSPIRKLVPLADAAKERGLTVYHLNIGQPDVPSPQVVFDALRKCDMKLIPYTNSAGNLSYRKGLARYYNNLGIDIDESQIIVTTGGSEAISIAVSIACDEGDELIVLEPFYTNYTTLAKICDVTLTPVQTDIRNNFALPDISEFEKKIGPRTKGILICNPGNPTGCVYTREEIEQLGAIARKHDLFLMVDEVYREFCYTDAPHFSALKLNDLDDNVILIDSVSKRYSLCGVRVGCIVSRNQEVIKTALKYGQSRLCSPALGQYVAEAALDTPKEYFAATKKEYIARRNLLVNGVNEIPGCFCPMPQGAFYAVAELPVKDADRFATWLLTDFSYKNSTVQITPAAGFYATPGRGLNQVRLAYVIEQDKIRASLECLRKGLETYPEK